MLEYQGHAVSLLWQSKQARRINALVLGAFHVGSPVFGGFVWLRPKGMNCIKTAAIKTHLKILIAPPSLPLTLQFRGRALAVVSFHLQSPAHRHGLRRVADLFVAGLVL